MHLNELKAAVSGRKTLAFNYDGKPRLVEPHALGLGGNGDLILRAYQVDGESATNPRAWKLFTINKAEGISISDVPSQAPRAGYKPGDRAMTTIFAELEV